MNQGREYLGVHCTTDVLQDMLATYSTRHQVPIASAVPAGATGSAHRQQDLQHLKQGHIGLFSNLRSPGVVVSAIFTLCKHLKLNHHVRYLAVEIYDRFMWRHIVDVRRDVLQYVQTEALGQKWTETEGTLTRQIWLRMISCIVVAFKTYSSSLEKSKRLAADCITFLREFVDYRCSVKTLRKAEVRVLTTLDYRLYIPMPISCLQVLLSVLIHNITSLEASAFYPAVYEVLDLFYLKRTTLRRILEQRWEHCRVLEKKESLQQLIQGTNLVLLCCSILGMVAFVSFPEDVLNQVFSELEYITDLPLHDILDLRDMLLLQLFN